MIEDLKTFRPPVRPADSMIAVDLLGIFLKTGEWGCVENGRTSEKEGLKEGLSEGMEGVEAYLKYREEELQMLLDTFPEAWRK